MAQGSLAAESYSAGGGFATNRGGQPDDDSAWQRGVPHSGERRTGQGGPAPTYVTGQGRDEHGPHGKNITEGFEDSRKFRDGMQAAIRAEVGSEDDPARAVERDSRFNQPSQGRHDGPRQGEATGDGSYGVLNDQEDV